MRSGLCCETRAVDVSLWEAVLPPEVLRLSDKLARVDALLDDPVFVAPFVPFFDPRVGRPFSPMEAGPQELPAAIAVSINSVQFLVYAWDFASATVQKVVVSDEVTTFVLGRPSRSSLLSCARAPASTPPSRSAAMHGRSTA